MKAQLVVLLALFLVLACPVLGIAEQPVQPLPKGDRAQCPYGYSSSGGYCAPMRDAKPALPKVGACPYGYTQSGSYCLALDKKPREAVPKTGACPYGYSQSGAYCLKSTVR